MQTASGASENAVDADPIWAAARRAHRLDRRSADADGQPDALARGERWRELGREVPAELEEAVRSAALATLVVPLLLTRVRDVVARPLLSQGPIAARYPDPGAPVDTDPDLLVRDAHDAQRRLVDAGFVEVGDAARYVDGPHERPLVLAPDTPSPSKLPPPAELAALAWRAADGGALRAAETAATGVEGVLTLAPIHHALVVAMHAWRHGPMSHIGHLVDVAVMADGLDADELRVTARRWVFTASGRTTSEAADAVLYGAPEPWALRTWARNLSTGRERTVLEGATSAGGSPASRPSAPVAASV